MRHDVWKALIWFQFAMVLGSWVKAAAPDTQLDVEEKPVPLVNADFRERLRGWAPNGQTLESFSPANNSNIVFATEAQDPTGASVLIATTRKNDWRYLKQSFRARAGAKYRVVANLRAEGLAEGCVQVVYGAGGDPISPRVADSTDWRRSECLFYGVDRSAQKGQRAAASIHSEASERDLTVNCELRLHVYAEGSGKVWFDNVRVTEVSDYAPNVRVTWLDSPATNGRVWLYAHVGGDRAPYWESPKWPMDAERRPAVSERGQNAARAVPGPPVLWLPLTNQEAFAGSRIIPVGVHFEHADRTVPKQVRARFEFASAPDEASILKTLEVETPGNTVGLFIPGALVLPEDFANGFRPIADDARDRNHAVRELALALDREYKAAPGQRTPGGSVKWLKHFYVEGFLSGLGRFYTDPAVVQMEVDTIARIGFSALDSGYAGLAGVYREAASQHGITNTHKTIRPLSGHFQNQEYDLASIRAKVATTVARGIAQSGSNDPAEARAVRFVNIGDEIAGELYEGPQYDAHYREFVKTQGMAPDDFGVKTWDNVKPYGSWNWRQSRSRRPASREDLAACRSFYWTVRHWSWCNASAYRMVTEEILKHWPQVKTCINHGPPWLHDYCSPMRGVDIWDFTRQNSVTAFLNEDWLNTYSFRNAGVQMNAYLADLSRSLGRINQAPAFAHVMPEQEDVIQLKLASVVGKGVKVIDLYRYGPAYASVNNWSSSASQVRGVARFIRKLSKVEDVLYPGQPPKAEVAMIWSSSASVWNNGNAPLFDHEGVYLALLHDQIPVEFVDELGIEQNLLKDYKVAYLTSTYLRRETQKALVEWVCDGGYLWLDALAATGDEYGQPCDLLWSAFGLAAANVSTNSETNYRPDATLAHVPALDTMCWEGNKEAMDAVGCRVVLPEQSPIAGGTPSNAGPSAILARFSDGSPAVSERAVGKGRVRYVGTYAGLSYARPVQRLQTRIETGYRERERRLITPFALLAGIRRPVECSVPGVEADYLDSDAGIGVVLANYTGKPLAEVTITISTHQSIRSVRSVDHGRLHFQREPGGIVFKLPLNLVDFVVAE